MLSEPRPRVAVLGTGAVGGYYGALLARAGVPVVFLARGNREALAEQGLTVHSPRGDFRLPSVELWRPGTARADWAVVAWKTTANDALPGTLREVLKPGGTVIVLQNGLHPEAAAFPAVAPEQIVSGLCFLCSQLDSPAVIRHLDYGRIHLAAYQPPVRAEVGRGSTPAGSGERSRAVAQAFRAAGVEIALEESGGAARWKKLVWNVPFNGLCALEGCDTPGVLERRALREQALGLMREVCAGAAACGYPLPSTFPEKMLAATESMTPYRPSMALDALAGRPLEWRAIHEAPLKAMERAGVDAPLLAGLVARLAAFRP